MMVIPAAVLQLSALEPPTSRSHNSCLRLSPQAAGATFNGKVSASVGSRLDLMGWGTEQCASLSV
eukprot:697198-Rhodomonas_salina.1